MSDRGSWEPSEPFEVVGEPFLFVAPIGTPFPPITDFGCLSDERWELLSPGVPDYPPMDDA